MDQMDRRNPTQQKRKVILMLHITSGHFAKGLEGICLNISMSLRCIRPRILLHWQRTGRGAHTYINNYLIFVYRLYISGSKSIEKIVRETWEEIRPCWLNQIGFLIYHTRGSTANQYYVKKNLTSWGTYH